MRWLRVLFFVILVLGVVAPTAAQAVGEDVLPNSPGSVLVFHKFIRGTAIDSDGTIFPKSEFEISVVCPAGILGSQTDVACVNNPVTLAPTVTLHGHWVCPGDPKAATPTCPDRDFTLTTTVNGTIRINPENLDPKTHTVSTQPPCDRGYLIVWVEGNANTLLAGTPIKFDGLIGDAVLRDSDSAISQIAAYNAFAIQAGGDEGVGVGLPASFDGNLRFDGDTNEYMKLMSRIFGTVRYENANTQTFLTLLTLDVLLGNQKNDVTNVDFNFYDANETPASTNTTFVCWQEVELSALNVTFAGKGLFSGQASDTSSGSFRTLLAIIETREVVPNTDPLFRGYAYSVYYDQNSVVNTTFFPKGSLGDGG